MIVSKGLERALSVFRKIIPLYNGRTTKVKNKEELEC